GHELRNPLAAVRNALLSARLDPIRVERAIEIASRQTDQLARLVDDLLDVANITQDRVRLNRDLVSVRELVGQALEATRHQLEERGVALSVAIACEGVRIEGDPARLEQAIVNLLTNAAKYSERGGRVELLCDRRGDRVEIRVRDQGVGISPELLPHIFDA